MVVVPFPPHIVFVLAPPQLCFIGALFVLGQRAILVPRLIAVAHCRIEHRYQLKAGEREPQQNIVVLKVRWIKCFIIQPYRKAKLRLVTCDFVVCVIYV